MQMADFGDGQRKADKVNFVITTSNEPGDEAATERQRRRLSSRLDVQTLNCPLNQ